MIGIVVVSHSSRLAEGVTDLVREVGGPEVRFRATGGVDAPGRPLGTDPLEVKRAVEEVWSDEGVLVLMDLGSAILSAETALELLDPSRRARVTLCEAPVVEGAVAAAVQARLGATLEQVAAEARSALRPKAEHLGTAPPRLEPPAPLGPPSEEVLSLRVTVQNPLGIHARPAARIVRTVGRFKGAEVQVEDLTKGRGKVSAKSLNALSTLGARRGHELVFTATGADAGEALAAIRALAEAAFGDGAEEAPPDAPRVGQAPAGEGIMRGLPVSPGIVVGPLRFPRRASPVVHEGAKGDPGAERSRLDAAVESTRRELEKSRRSAAERAGRRAEELIDAHILLLDDPTMVGAARTAIAGRGLSAAAAWQGSVERVLATYRALEDPYQRARANDVEEVGRQVLAALVGSTPLSEPPAEPGILVADDLSPAEVARLDPAKVLGIALARGGSTSHAAILARALSIPAIAAVGDGILALADGTPAALDGKAGCLYVEPPREVVLDLEARWEVERRVQAAAMASAALPAVTRDGRRIHVVANLRTVADAREAVACGADGVGVLRTELLFLDRRSAPDEEEQFTMYRSVAQAMEGRKVVIRTLDAGGDKPLPYLDLGREGNPYLGWRAIRYCLALPELFKVQLRAIVRVACEYPVQVMFPMVATLSEWRAARALLTEARAEVVGRGLMAPGRIETGMMVEVPSAALLADRFAREVDFFSIGTNDLTQYTLAAERGNARLRELSDACHPAVLALVARVTEAARPRGTPVAVCGEAAADPIALQIFVGLGVEELSMSGRAIPDAKEMVRKLLGEELRARANRALLEESAEAVRALFR